MRRGRLASRPAENRARSPTGIIGCMNPLLSRLQPYPFERLRQLFAGVTPNPALRPISLGIGEPKHPTPRFIKDALAKAMDTPGHDLTGYPPTAGTPELRAACAGW